MSKPTPSFLNLLILIFFLSSSSPISVSSMDCHQGDREALLKVKQSLHDPPELSSWLPATNCCDWDNLYCTRTGRVYNVYIYNAKLSADIPAAFGDLSALQTLSLQDMPGLTGPLPPSFGNLSELDLLEIRNTSLSGAIPGFLTGTNLSALILSYNHLSGRIPTSLSRLPHLRYVDLSYNQLSGSIPPGLIHESYQFLYLSNNRLTGEIPKSYGEGDVNTLDFSHNKLAGDPSSSLFGIAKTMQKIDLSWNQFRFDMTKVAFPHYLTYLDLSHNRIYGAVAKSVKDLYSLRDFNVSYNELCGEIPTGRAMAFHGAESYLDNKCLCGTPLPPCSH